MNHTAQELAFAGPAALAGLVRRRELKPRELVELFLARIEQLDPQLNAYRVVMGEQALAEADAQPGLDGHLAGVPGRIKILLSIDGAKAGLTRGDARPECFWSSSCWRKRPDSSDSNDSFGHTSLSAFRNTKLVWIPENPLAMTRELVPVN